MAQLPLSDICPALQGLTANSKTLLLPSQRCICSRTLTTVPTAGTFSRGQRCIHKAGEMSARLAGEGFNDIHIASGGKSRARGTSRVTPGCTPVFLDRVFRLAQATESHRSVARGCVHKWGWVELERLQARACIHICRPETSPRRLFNTHNGWCNARPLTSVQTQICRVNLWAFLPRSQGGSAGIFGSVWRELRWDSWHPAGYQRSVTDHPVKDHVRGNESFGRPI